MNCPFCSELSTPKNSLYYIAIGQYAGLDSRVLLETENWYAIPTLGCLTVGYVLLVCKQHYLSLANLNDSLWDEMLELKEKVERIIWQELGMPCIAFEHGVTSQDYSGANSVDHIHLHILPFHEKAWNLIPKKALPDTFQIIRGYSDLRRHWQSAFPNTYLLFQDIDRSIYYSDDIADAPSQLFRRYLAPLLNVDKWNWKEEYYKDNILQTIALFYKQTQPSPKSL